jgi:hypothetical protein
MSADPELFKGKVCPRLKHITCDIIRAALDDMNENELIILYESDGDRYLQYRNFHKHNRVRQDREGDSQLPDPLDENISTVLLPDESGLSTAQVKLREVKLREDKLSRQSVPDCPHMDILNLYHSILPGLPHIKEWTPARQALLRSRWKENKDRQTLRWWTAYFESIKLSDFLMGKVGGSNGRPPFMATLEWLIQPKNMVKVLEGNYSRVGESNDRRWQE